VAVGVLFWRGLKGNRFATAHPLLGTSLKNMSFKAKYSSFEYSVLTKKIGQANLDVYSNKMLMRFAAQTKKWSKEKNAEWLVRTYLSMKMIFSATIMLNTLKYSNRKNLKIVEPYLIYYSLLSCCRAIVFVLPDVTWNKGELATLTHSKALTLTIDTVKAIDKTASAEINRLLKLSKSFREMYSYHFPAKGLSVIPEKYRIEIDEVIQACTLLSEIAQLNSEFLESSLSKNARYDPLWEEDVDEDIFKACFEYKFNDGGKYDDVIFDEDDWYRFGRMAIKYKRPFSLLNSMSEGMTEDFFNSWTPENNDDDDVFDIGSPCPEWEIIFPIP
jgi:hypothetical protein